MEKLLPSSRNVTLSRLSFLIPISILILSFCLIPFTAVFAPFTNIIRFVVISLCCISIAFGMISLRANPALLGSSILMSLIGIMLSLGLIYPVWNIIKLPSVTGTIHSISCGDPSESHFGQKCSLTLYVDLPADESIERNLDPQMPIFYVHTTPNTAIYEQVGEWDWQKRIVKDDQLREGQHIQIEWDGTIFITMPAQIYAISITILNK